MTTDTTNSQGIEKLCKVCRQSASEMVVFGLHKSKDGKSYYKRSTCQSCEAKITKDYLSANKQRAIEIKQRYRAKNFGTIKYHVQEKISTWRKASSVPSDLTVDYLISLYNQQDGYCYYTGEKMIFGWVDGKVHHNSLSLDKLDPTKGYIQGNVVWCSYLVNTMKQDMNEEEFYRCLKQILSRKGKE